MILTEKNLREIIRHEILREIATGAEKVYSDNDGFKFAIRNGVLTLVGRPAAKGNAGLPKPIPTKVLNATVAALKLRYKGDAALDALTKGASAAPVVQQTSPEGVSMYGAKVGDAKNYTEYRVYSDGTIKRFGVMKGGRWTMDDPAKDVPANQRAATAQSILTANQYDAGAKASLATAASGKAAAAVEVGISQKVLSMIRKTLLGAGAPIAYVAFADYLMGRTSTFTAGELPSNYQADLAKVAKYAMTRASPRTGKKGEILHDNAFVYNDFWRNASKKLGQGVPGTPLDGQGTKGTGTVEALEFFLGGMVVTQEGQNYVIRDIYDYDDFFVSPKAYDEMSEFLGALAKAGSFYNVIRKAAAFRQTSGYTGFPVDIRLPISLAADFKV